MSARTLLLDLAARQQRAGNQHQQQQYAGTTGSDPITSAATAITINTPMMTTV